MKKLSFEKISRGFLALSLLASGIVSSVPASAAFHDPTEGKPFFPWLWEDQVKPSLHVAASDTTGYGILVGGTLATIYANGKDARVYDLNERTRWIPSDYTPTAAFLASGGPFIAIALGQLYWDQPNGLAHARALAFTSLNHITMALLIQRERPNGTNKLSFPSGHASSIFASATALSYAYGPWVGVPLYALATGVAMSRVSDRAHWVSDVVAGATLGIFWGRTTALAGRLKANDYVWQALPHEDGALIQVTRAF